ncbi:WD40-repeat-containing domain protein, partial [Lactarius deliciosus]
DHTCDTDMFLRTTAILQVHSDEVWSVEWSHNGKFLASASKDRSVIIWSVGVRSNRNPDISLHLHLQDHPFAVTCLAWSTDDTILLSSSEQYINMWNTETGICTRTIEAQSQHLHGYPMDWGSFRLTRWKDQSTGKTSSFSRSLPCELFYNYPHYGVQEFDGKQRDSWDTITIRIADLAVSPDCTRLVAVGASAGDPVLSTLTPESLENLMIVYDLTTKQPELSVSPRGGFLTSVNISSDSQYALVNHAPGTRFFCGIYSRGLTCKYTGQRQTRHVIRSCFGGVDGNLVVSGSEDGNVYIWDRERAVLLDVLTGHGSGSVNSVAWNPRNTQMFASCSDDFTIRLWEPSVGVAEAESSSGITHRTADEQSRER